jgi:hypothetical protein
MNGTRHDPMRIQYMAREVEMYSLTRSEIVALRSSDGALDSCLASASAGGLIGTLIALFTGQMSTLVHGSFVAAAITTGFFTLFFGVRTHLVRKEGERSLAALLRDSENNVRTMSRRPGA